MAEEIVKKGFKALLQSAQLYVWAGILLVSTATFIFTLGGKTERKNNHNLDIEKQVVSIASFQKRDSISRRIQNSKVNKKIDSLFTMTDLVSKDMKKIKVSQDSLRAYFIRKAVTKDDMKDIMNVFDFVQKKNRDTILIPYQNGTQQYILTSK
jgi:hypothetical protein